VAKSGRADAVVAADSAAEIIARLGGRLGDITRSLQQHVLTEVSEFRDDTQLAQLLKDSVEQNVDTVFTAIRHGIPIENVEPPTAALEHARRLAQRGVSANALIRSYRLGQQKLLNIVLDEVRATDLDPRRSLDVFQQITTTTFSYIDWISQQVIAAYQAEHDRWLETQNTTRTVRIRAGRRYSVARLRGASCSTSSRRNLGAWWHLKHAGAPIIGRSSAGDGPRGAACPTSVR